jgi:hypothetical protein
MIQPTTTTPRPAEAPRHRRPFSARKRLAEAREDPFGSLAAATLLLAFSVLGFKVGWLLGGLAVTAAVLILAALGASGWRQLLRGETRAFVTLGVLVIVPTVIITLMIQRGTFSRDAWTDDALLRPRQAMVADLLTDHTLQGATRDELVALLGLPDVERDGEYWSEMEWDFPRSTWEPVHVFQANLRRGRATWAGEIRR